MLFLKVRADRATAKRFLLTAALLRAEQRSLSLFRNSLLSEAGRLRSITASQKNTAITLLASRVADYYRMDGRHIRSVKRLGDHIDRQFVD